MAIASNSVTAQERALEPIELEIKNSQVIVITSIVAMSVFGALAAGGVLLALSNWSLIFTPAVFVISMLFLELFSESYVVYRDVNPLKNRLIQLKENVEEMGRNGVAFFEDFGHLNLFQLLHRAIQNMAQENNGQAVHQEYTDLIENRALEQQIDDLSQRLFCFPALVRLVKGGEPLQLGTQLPQLFATAQKYLFCGLIAESEEH